MRLTAISFDSVASSSSIVKLYCSCGRHHRCCAICLVVCMSVFTPPGAWVENQSQHEHETVQDLLRIKTATTTNDKPVGGKNDVNNQGTLAKVPKTTNHDERVRDCRYRVEAMFKDEREDGEDTAEAIDCHEDERDAKNGAVLVNLVELGSQIRKKKIGERFDLD
jgi:hypothetical protein